MPTLTTWQHIYSNVEASQSPSNRGGFQTLFYSKEGLTPDDVRHIEHRVFYLPGTKKTTKRFFFSLPSGHLVFGSVIPLFQRDDAGRTGIHLAHSLIIPRSAFEASPFHPLHFFQFAPFATTLEPLLATGDLTSGSIDAVTFDIPAVSAKIQSNWPSKDLLAFLYHVLHRASQPSEHHAIALIGSSQAIESTLNDVLSLVPHEYLPTCSFDTVFQGGGDVRRTPYWAVGLDSPPRQSYYTVIDLERPTLHRPKNPLSLYEKWVETILEKEDVETVIQQKDIAFSFCQFMEGKRADFPTTSPVIAESVFRLNESLAASRLQSALLEKTPAELAERIFNTFSKQLSVEQKLQVLASGIDKADLLDQLYLAYSSTEFKKPGRPERAALNNVLDPSVHPLLSLVSSCWEKDTASLGDTLKTLNKKRIVEFIRLALSGNLGDLNTFKSGLVDHPDADAILEEVTRMDLSAKEPSGFFKRLFGTKH